MASVTSVDSKAATTTTVVPSANPSVSGQWVTFTATVSVNSPGSAAVANPSGTVTFKDGLTTLGTGTLSTSGGVTTASFGNGTLSTASHSITASYGGGTDQHHTRRAPARHVRPADTTPPPTTSGQPPPPAH